MNPNPTHNKSVCTLCGWKGLFEQLLVAPNPFCIGDQLHGCPGCGQVNCFHSACDEPGCWEPDTCGMPTDFGYRRTCYKHIPKAQPEQSKT
jgi:hypothetical protein